MALLLTFVLALFTQRSSAFGDATLSATQILFQLLLLTGLALDGPALAAEAMVGQAIGAKNRARYDAALKRTAVVSAAAALLFTGLYARFGGALIEAMSTSEEVRAQARIYLPWVVASPLVVAACFHLDGVFIGATRGARHAQRDDRRRQRLSRDHVRIRNIGRPPRPVGCAHHLLSGARGRALCSPPGGCSGCGRGRVRP